MTFKKAIELHKSEIHENRVEALKIFREIKQLYWIGYYHHYGYGGLEINIDKAMKYYHIASLENNAEAMIRLSNLIIGKNQEENEEEIKNINRILATTLLKKSAELGHVIACYQYGDILINRKLGNEKKLLNGYTYMKKAADNNHEKAIEKKITFLYQFKMATTPPHNNNNDTENPLPNNSSRKRSYTANNDTTSDTQRRKRSVEDIEDDILDVDEQINILKKRKKKLEGELIEARECLRARRLRKKLRLYETNREILE
ncbi:14294_t:CDS:2 [Cetraspora pellucida]|uniref:14294_t:CDS:1 n=1 Tax=Cetraspora pellucida TaxID=1433469 RepID=A0A9N9NMU6_9GLOM|nr:14294_t:CDS:2 [Cetraspora pellucida]